LIRQINELHKTNFLEAKWNLKNHLNYFKNMTAPLFDSLCNKEILYFAWLRVKEKDTAGGIDFLKVQGYALAIFIVFFEITLLLF